MGYGSPAKATTVLNYYGIGTDYIDFIRTDRITSKIMRGRDKYNRSFISFRYKLNDINERFSPEVYVETIFQRYTDAPNQWTCGGHTELNIINKNIIHKFFFFKKS